MQQKPTITFNPDEFLGPDPQEQGQPTPTPVAPPVVDKTSSLGLSDLVAGKDKQPERKSNARTPRAGLLPHAAALATRITGGLTSGIAGAAPSPITTPAAAAIAGAGEYLAQRMESADPVDYKGVGLESAIGAVPFGKLVKVAKPGISVAKQALVNAARMGGFIEASNMARRYHNQGTILPQSATEAMFDLATSGIGGLSGLGGARGNFPPSNVGPLTDDALEKAIAANVVPAKEPVLVPTSKMKNATARPGGGITATEGLIKQGKAVEPTVTAPTANTRGGLRVGPGQPVSKITNRSIGASNADYAKPGPIKNVEVEHPGRTVEGAIPEPPAVTEVKGEVARTPSKIDPEKLDSDGIARRPDAYKQGVDEAIAGANKIGEAQLKVNQSIKAREDKLKVAEQRADQENLRQSGGTTLAQRKAVEDKALEQRAGEIQKREATQQSANEMLDKEIKAARAKAEMEGIIHSDDFEPRVSVSEVSEPVDTRTGQARKRTTYVEKPPAKEEMPQETRPINKGPQTPPPAPAAPKAAPAKPTDPKTVLQTIYPSESEALKALGKLGQKGSVVSRGKKRGWTIKLDEPVAPKAETPVTPPPATKPVAPIKAAPKAPETPVAPAKGVDTPPPAAPPTAPPEPPTAGPTPAKPKGPAPKPASPTAAPKAVPEAPIEDAAMTLHKQQLQNAKNPKQLMDRLQMAMQHQDRMELKGWSDEELQKGLIRYKNDPEGLAMLNDEIASRVKKAPVGTGGLEDSPKKPARFNAPAKPEAKPAAPVAAKPKLRKGEVDAITRDDVQKWTLEQISEAQAKYPKDKRLQTILADEVKRRGPEQPPEPPAPAPAPKPKGPAPKPAPPTRAEAPKGEVLKPDPVRSANERGGAVVVASNNEKSATPLRAEPKVTDTDVAAELKNWTSAELANASKSAKNPSMKAAIDAEIKRRAEAPKGAAPVKAAPVKAEEPAAPAVKVEGEAPNTRKAYDKVYSQANAQARANDLTDNGWTNVVVKEGTQERGGPTWEVHGTPPTRNVGKLGKGVDVDLSKTKNAEGVKAQVIAALKNEMKGTTDVSQVTTNGGNIHVNGKLVASVNKGRRGNAPSLRFNDSYSAAANKGELPTIDDLDGIPYSEAVKIAADRVRGWWMKNYAGTDLTEVRLPNGFSIKIPKDNPSIAAAIRNIEKSGPEAWQGIVDKVEKTGNPLTDYIEYPWGKPGSKSKYTAEQITSPAFSRQEEVLGKVRQLANAFRTTDPKDLQPVHIKLDNGFEMTIQPHQAKDALERLEKAPMDVWADKVPPKNSITVATKYGTSFDAKGESQAPGVKLPTQGLGAATKGQPTPKPIYESVRNQGAEQASPLAPKANTAKPKGRKSATFGKQWIDQQAAMSDSAAAEKVAQGKAQAVKQAETQPPAQGVPTTKDGLTKAQILQKHGLDPNMGPEDLALETQAAADRYFALRTQAQADSTLQPELRAAGEKFGNLRAASALAAKESGTPMAKVVEPTALPKPTGKGPTSDDLMRMAPEQQTAVLNDVVKKFKNNPEQGLTAVQAMVHAGTLTAGALIGAQATPDDPLTGAIIGGTAGAFAPAVMRTLINHVNGLPPGAVQNRSREEIGRYIGDKLAVIKETIPDIYRSFLLSKPDNWIINSFFGPFGSGMLYSLERGMSGDIRGWKALREFMHLPNLGKEWHLSLQEARSRLTNSNERADMLGVAGPEWLRRGIEFPAEGMTAGDVATRNVLMRAGFMEHEARTATLTSEPISGFFSGMGNWRKTKGPHGHHSFPLRMILPFYRTSANQVEQSVLRVPVLGYMLRRYLHQSQAPIREQIAQGAISGGVFGISYAVGKNCPPEQEVRLRKLLSNFGGPYGLEASAGFIAGVAAKSGKSKSQQAGAVLKQLPFDLPMPTAEPFRGLYKAYDDITNDKTPDLPYGVIPPWLSSKEQLSLPTIGRFAAGEEEFARPTHNEYSLAAPFVADKELKPKPPTARERELNIRKQQLRERRQYSGDRRELLRKRRQARRDAHR